MTTQSVGNPVVRENPYRLTIYPNPTRGAFTLDLHEADFSSAHYFISTPDGRWIDRGQIRSEELLNGKIQFAIDPTIRMDSLFFTIVLDHTFYLSERINLQR
jgi:hypothetical protein